METHYLKRSYLAKFFIKCMMNATCGCLYILCMTGCGHSSGPAAPSSSGKSLAELLAAPEMVEMDGEKCILETYIYRNLQPRIIEGRAAGTSDGPPLIVIARLKTLSGEPLPKEITLDRLWVINGAAVWETGFSDEERPEKKPSVMERIARNGPACRDAASVTAVVEIQHKGLPSLIKAPRQKVTSAF